MGILGDVGKMGGTALGAEFGPVGSQIGSALGGWAGDALGGLFGGGSSAPPPPPVQFSSMSPQDQSNYIRSAQAPFQNTANNLGRMGMDQQQGQQPQQGQAPQQGLGQMLGGMGSDYGRGYLSQGMGQLGESAMGYLAPEYRQFGGTLGRYAGNQLANYGGNYLGNMAQRGLDQYAPSLGSMRFGAQGNGPRAGGMGRYGQNQMVPPAPPNPPQIWNNRPRYAGPNGMRSGVNDRRGQFSQYDRNSSGPRDLGGLQDVPGMYSGGYGGGNGGSGYEVGANYEPPRNYGRQDNMGMNQMQTNDPFTGYGSSEYNPAPSPDFYEGYADGGSVGGLSSMLRRMPRMASGF